MLSHLPLASLTRVFTARAWPYRVLQSVFLPMWSSWGCVLRFKPHWMFQIYKYVIKGLKELTSCSSLLHSYLFPLLDVLYRQVGNLSFWTERCAEFVMAVSNHIVAAIQGAGNTMPSA